MIEELAVMKTLEEMINWLESKLSSEITADSEHKQTGDAEDMRPKSKGEYLPRGLLESG